MRIGYARVSTADQNLDLQIDALNANGCEFIFKEKMSGKIKDRPELVKCFAKLSAGDILVVWKLDRLGRSLKNLIEIVTTLAEKGVTFHSLQDGINTSTATGKFTFNLFACLAEFERELTKERTAAGVAAARARGRNGGRPAGLKADALKKAKTIKSLYDLKKQTVEEIAGIVDVGVATAYRYIKIMIETEKKEKENAKLSGAV